VKKFKIIQNIKNYIPNFPKILRLTKKATLSLTKNSFFISLNVAITLVTAFSIIAFSLYKTTDVPENLDISTLNQTSVIYDRTGEKILYEIYDEENRKVIPSEKIPNVLRVATIASEDNNFHSHSGIDLKAIIRAAKTNFENKDKTEGASTITQQLVRNLFLDREKTIKRKVLEIVMALKMEKVYSKEQILDMYLNVVPYGSNAYGVETASQTFFRKNASELTLDEAAILAALPKAPTHFSPYGKNTTELIARQQKILDKMAELGLENPSSVEEAKRIITLSKVYPRKNPITAPHFVFYVREVLEKKYGRETLQKGGLRIQTSIDLEMQRIAEKTVREGVKKNLNYGAENASLVSLDPKSGQILAMVGSRDYFNQEIDGQVNVSTRIRQPGSSFKPFAYGEAFEKGYQPETLLADFPTDFGPDGSGTNYIPRNYDGKFHGIVSMRQALGMSLNIPAVKTLHLAGVKDTISLATKMGITTLDENGSYGLALVLGGGGVTLLEETAGYAVFANDGRRNPLESILKIENSRGEQIYGATSPNLAVIDPQTARKVNSILADNDARAGIFGSNSALHIPGKTVAVKTGTSQEFRDGWTLGYTPDIAVGVWVGNNNNRPMKAGSAGFYVATPIWRAFMNEIIENYPVNNEFVAYQKSPSAWNEFPLENFVVRYFDRKNGRELSPQKRERIDPRRIEIRYEKRKESIVSLETQKSRGVPWLRDDSDNENF
jgi:1A family penicillin-binding protein